MQKVKVPQTMCCIQLVASDFVTMTELILSQSDFTTSEDKIALPANLAILYLGVPNYGSLLHD